MVVTGDAAFVGGLIHAAMGSSGGFGEPLEADRVT